MNFYQSVNAVEYSPERFEDAYVPDVISQSDLEFFDRSGYVVRMEWGKNFII